MIQSKPPEISLRLETINFSIKQSKLGAVLIAETGDGICAVLLGDNSDILKFDLRNRFPQVRLIEAETPNSSAVTDLANDPRIEIQVPLDLHGTEFQLQVWKELIAIPVGATSSYTEIAREIGRPAAARAVATACAANSVALLVPCHRVIRNTGEISGYRWGVERKKKLLKAEAQIYHHQN